MKNERKIEKRLNQKNKMKRLKLEEIKLIDMIFTNIMNY